MIIIPYRLAITFRRIPIINAFIIAVTAAVFVFSTYVDPENAFFGGLVLREWNLEGMLGCMFLHGGLVHLLGNMMFLWVFGNAICSTVGNAVYPLVYALLGLGASAAHLFFSGTPAVGASGAINGVVGMAFVLFPANKLDCVYGFFIPFTGLVKFGKFTIKSYWMIAFWCAFDILGTVMGGGHVAYWAHIGGFVAGLVLASMMIGLKWTSTSDPTLIDVMRDRKPHEKRLPSESCNTILAGHGGSVLTSLPAQAPGISASEDRLLPSPDIAPAPNRAPVAIPPRRQAAPSTLKLRILKVVRGNERITCYCANDGDEVHDLRVTPSPASPVEIHPQATIGRRESCWITLARVGTEAVGQLEILVTYDNGAGARGTQSLVLPAP